VCTCVGNYRSRGVVIAKLRSSVRSLLHQCRDLHRLIYLYLSEDRKASFSLKPTIEAVGVKSLSVDVRLLDLLGPYTSMRSVHSILARRG
jgi:hypothetical protein